MKPKADRKRLDLLLVERGCAESLQQAMAMILAGEVQVDGQRRYKAGRPVSQDARIEIVSRQQKCVSRGGMKLEGALEDFEFHSTATDELLLPAEVRQSRWNETRRRSRRLCD